MPEKIPLKVQFREARTFRLPTFVEFITLSKNLLIVGGFLFSLFMVMWGLLGDDILMGLGIPTHTEITTRDKKLSDKTDFVLLMITLQQGDFTPEQKRIYKNQYMRGELNVETLAWSVFDKQ